MKKTVFLYLAAALIFSGLILSGTASAIPPTRPIDIKLAAEQEIPALKHGDKMFSLPVEIVVSEEIQTPQITTEVVKTKNLSREVIKKRRTSFKKGEKSFRIGVPTIQEKGIYKVVITAGDDRGAVYDRAILFQVVDEKGTTLYTQQQWRKMQQEKRRRTLEKTRSVRDYAGKLNKVEGKDLDRIKINEAAKNYVIVRTDKQLGEEEKYVVDKSNDAWRKRDPITVRGRLVYTDFDGTVRPIVNGGVYLYDDDTFADDFIDSVTTNWNGEFSFSVNNDDGPLQNGRDIYFKLKLRNTRWRVKAFGDYQWSSNVHNDLSDGAVIDYGTLAPDSDHEAIQIFEFINRGWQHITSVGGRDPGYVEIKYPGSGDFYNGKVNISAGSNTAPDIVLHEYGHFLMDAAYPGGSSSPGGAHNFGETLQDRRLSWSEGWATAFMLSVCNDGQYNWDEGTSEGPGEWPDCSVQNDAGGRSIEFYSNSTNRVGERQEGRVAAALLDFMDGNNDDNGGTEDRGRNDREDENNSHRITLATIYNDVMWGSGHDDMLEFWQSLSGELSGYTLGEGMEIMQYNWMSEPEVIDCVASKVAAAELKDYDKAIDGLRAFRDQALKPTVDGRNLIQIYYRHSPEIAMLLIKNPEVKKQATKIVSHFSMIGEATVKHQKLEKLAAKKQQIIPANILRSAESVFNLVNRQGSKELQADMMIVKAQIKKYAGLDINAAIQKSSELKKVNNDDPKFAINQHDFAPVSRKADWALIAQNLPEIKLTDPDQINEKDDEILTGDVRKEETFILQKLVLFAQQLISSFWK